VTITIGSLNVRIICVSRSIVANTDAAETSLVKIVDFVLQQYSVCGKPTMEVEMGTIFDNLQQFPVKQRLAAI